MNDLPLVDSHLDLAENVTLFGGELTLRELPKSGRLRNVRRGKLPGLYPNSSAVAERGEVIGLMLYSGFLKPGWKGDQSASVTLDEHLRQHANYIANLSGWEHLGVGSDLDGGFGLEESPSEIDTVADLHIK